MKTYHTVVYDKRTGKDTVKEFGLDFTAASKHYAKLIEHGVPKNDQWPNGYKEFYLCSVKTKNIAELK